MLFNSLEFVLFFALVYGLYIVFVHRAQNVLLLVASYVFYGWWDWRFLGLILASTIVDFVCGIKIGATEAAPRRRLWLWVSMTSNLGVLGFFKYFNFFAESLDRALAPLGMHADWTFATIILPVGISFYTFQTMSYTIDVYRREMKPTHDFLNFAVFVSYFPQLVAGPIERARVLLPQIERPRRIRYQQLRDGFRLILVGYILKLVVAENMAPFTRSLFNQPEHHHGLNVLFGLYAAAFQIFGDFAGYTNIARGISKLMGIELMRNFDQPYFATNPSDFWRRWHISLSTWLRDYLYISLGGNRGGQLILYRNLMITMVLGGLWHGAALNFVAWGVFHGTILILHRIMKPTLDTWSDRLPLNRPIFKTTLMILFFHVTCLGWMLFFVKRLSHVKTLLINLFQSVEPVDITLLVVVGLFGGMALMMDILRERHPTDEEPVISSRGGRLVAYCAGVAVLMMFGAFQSSEFIYFQF
ncbi:MAG TPA: membrane-bound O-acyltransferase family protein [Planctomycetaceae bacterium]|nr:membrane-bound O-acyltransferase family protein [Planctomycetaceae bacterium]